MLDLFQDPVAYFTEPSREMKDKGYKQQCVVALKEAFRYTHNREQTGNTNKNIIMYYYCVGGGGKFLKF